MHDSTLHDYPIALAFVMGISTAGVAQWLEHQTPDRKVASSIPRRSSGRFSSPGSTFCAESYFGVTAVARKRSRSLRQKWQAAGYS